MLPRLQFATVLYYAANAFAYAPDTVGKTGTLTLTSQVIGPDGFNRSCVLSLRLFSLGESIYVSSEKRASVINGVHPGPLIAINKVGSQQLFFERKAEGSRFRVTLSR